MRPPRIAVLLTLLLAAPAAADEIERNSVPVKPATEAKEGWSTPGFRLSLQLGWQLLSPVRAPPLPPGPSAPGAPGGNTGAPVFIDLPAGDGIALGIEPGIRLTRSLAVSVALHYAASSGRIVDSVRRGTGLVWGTTANIAWFPVETIYLGAGAGYGGLLGSCHATGAMLLARVGAQLVVSDVFAMGPLVQLGGTVVSCKESAAYRAADLPSKDAPPWVHDELFFAWDFSWR